VASPANTELLHLVRYVMLTYVEKKMFGLSH